METIVSEYARVFNSENPYWNSDESYNRFFLQAQQNYFNQKLLMKGFVFLNEIYETLGFECIPAGQLVGWLRNGKDGYIDFKIDKDENEDYTLDFNVDGVVHDKI